MKRLLLFAALIAWSGMAGAVVYKWIDAQGKLQYGDRPPDGVHAEVVEFLGARPGRTTTARASESAPPAQSITVSPGCGFSRAATASFHSRWTPPLIRSFIRS